MHWLIWKLLTTIGPVGFANIYGKRSAASKNAGKNRRANKRALQMAHQWEVADLRKAGLNPILSANNDPGFPIGGGTAGATGAQDIAALGGAVSAVVGSATKGAKAKSEIRTAKETAEKTYHEAITAGAQSATAEEQAVQARMSTRVMQKTFERDMFNAGKLFEIDKSDLGEWERTMSRALRPLTGFVKTNLTLNPK